MAVAQTYRLARLAGSFPPGLNSSDAPWKLKPGETPDGYGYDLTVDDGIKVGTCPSGTARVAKAVTVGGTAYQWHFGRLWNFATTVLTYGAKFYDAVYLPQGLGKEYFNEDASAILALVPIEPAKLAVLKATGGYVLSNVDDRGANFGRTDLLQELALAAANQVAELDGVIYVTNAVGLTGYKDGQSEEISRKIRGETLTGAALTVDNSRRRVIVGASHVYDTKAQAWFKYDGSSFRFTSRQMTAADWSPFAVDRVLFVIQHTAETDGAYLTYQVKYEDAEWTDPRDVLLPYVAGKFSVISESLTRNLAAKRFQVRVTDMSSTVVLREIWCDTNAKQGDDWSA